MATFQITGPDGKKYKVSGANAQGAYEALMKHLGNPAGGGVNGANRPASAETTRPEDTGGFGTRDNPLAPVEAPEIPGQGAVAAQAPASADARPSFPALPQPLATPQAPDRALVEAMTTPPPPPVRPRSADPLTFGMMGGLGQDQEDWARREISRIEAERAAAGGLPTRPRPRPVDLAPMQEPVTPDQPQYTPTGEAIFAELGNAPERVARGFAGNDLLAAERGIHVNLTDIGAIKRGASELAAVEQQMTAMKAEMNANPRRAPDLQDAYLELAAKRNQLRALYGSALDMIQTERGELSDDQRARHNAQTRVDTLEAQMTPVSAKPGLSRAVVSGISSVADMAPGLVTSLVTKNPLPMMAYLGAYSRGSTYVDKRAEGYSPEKASRAANLYALAEAIPEALPLHVILKKGGGALWKIGGGAATEAASEVLTQGLQTLVDMGVLDERMTWAEASAAMAESGMAGGVMGGLMGGGAVLADNVADSVAKRKEREGTPADPRPNQPSMATPRDSRQKDDAATVAPSQPAAPSQDPLAAALMPDAAPQPPRAGPGQSPAPQADAAPTPPNATPEQPADAGRFEIMDEVETVDGETRPTGRKVRVDLETGQASVVDAEEAAGEAAVPPAGATAQVGQGPDQPQDSQASGAAPAAPAADSPKKSPRNVVFLDENDIQSVGTDAKTMQYKAGGDEHGVTDRLRGVTEWRPERAGMSIVYEYADGRRVVADGHQRLGLAKRLAAEGKPIQLPAIILRETDGVTPGDARVAAALKNIAEGSGTAIDAAKVLRQTGQSPADLSLPPNSAIVRDASGLQRLSDDAFGMVVNGAATEAHGAIVGRVVDNKAAQPGILSLLTNLKPANAFEAESIARQAAAETATETQDSLFGPEEITGNLYLERARVLDRALRRLKDDIKTFRTMTERADAIASVGNQLVTAENQQRLDQDAKVRDYLTSQANMKGPISEALSAAARDYKSSGKIGPAVNAFVAAVRSELEGNGGSGQVRDQGGQETRPDGGTEPAPAEPQAEVTPSADPAPQGDDLFNAMLPQQAGKTPDQVRAEAEVKVRANQSKIRKVGGNGGDAGPLFDPQGDLLDQKPAAKPDATDQQKAAITAMLRIAQDFERRFSTATDAKSSEFLSIAGTTEGRDLLTRMIGKSAAERRQIADAWVREMGQKTGNIEYIVILNKAGDPVAIGRGVESFVGIDGWMINAGRAGELAYITHNHPNGSSFSAADIDMMFLMRADEVVAIGNGEGRHSARPGPALDGFTTTLRGAERVAFRKMLDRIFAAVHGKLQGRVTAAFGNPAEAKRLIKLFDKAEANTVMLALQRAGIIEYDGPAQQALNAAELTLDEFSAETGRVIDQWVRRAGLPVAAGGRGGATGHNAARPGNAPDRAGDRATGTDSGNDGAGGRVQARPDDVTDDFEGALDDIFGKPKPAPRSSAAIAKDLGDLFGEPPSRGFREGDAIDMAKYAKAVPLFREALAGMPVTDTPRREVFAAMIRPLAANGLTRDAVARMRPYFERFLEDVDRGIISLDQEAGNVSDPDAGVERDRGDADSGDGMGPAGVSPAAGGNGQGAGSRGGASGGRGGRRTGGQRVSDRDAAPVGERRDPGLQGRDGERDGQSSDGGDGAAGRHSGEPGLPPDESPAGEAGKHARSRTEVADRRAAQDAADRKASVGGVRLADEQNIRHTLPLLLPEQQDDVLKVERRFAKPDGHGMLITNGTGTGKTYSGGGVIKRMAQAGKTNILIIAPSQGILDYWVQAGADLGLSISKLDDTNTAGTGIVATTYANLGVNGNLAGRDWDLVVTDESHTLSRNQDGDETAALRTLRAITNRPADLARKFDMLNQAEADKLHAMRDGEAKTAAAHAYIKRREAFVVAEAKKPRAKVLFLSATPFAYDKNTDYAEGYLFDYPKDGHVGHSRQSGRNLFMVENFGYRIRYHKLTKPEAAVDSGVFEREFHEKLRREGVLSGRHLNIEPDYERRFVRSEDAQGSQIDAVMDFIREKASAGDADPQSTAYRALSRAVSRKFNYLKRMQLLEAIKARTAQADIDRHLAAGRKVVIFHDYNIGGGFNPFRPMDDISEDAAMIAPDSAAGQDALFGGSAQEGYDLLVKARPEVEKLNFADYLPPVVELTKRYGKRAAVYNGTIPNKDRAKAKADFNKDGSGVDIIIVQSAAGESGISLHDVTGTHQRALINLGMPTRPTTALQEEGRIRREGSVTDAMFHYYTIGTTWERQAFAARIAERSGTVENLALGSEARAIRESFIDAYDEADVWEPSDGDGKGGKDRDRRSASTTPYEQAKTHYFGRVKTTGKRDQRDGLDFYPTPEPLAFKMVEWAGIRPYERVLEPSAGDGSIARYFPDHADRTIVEPSQDLLSRAQLRSVGSRAVGSTFEDYNLVNKHHVIVMNPPFGSGGKTAMEHLAKAARHLRPGGRIVALIPTGPAADKRFDAWWDSDASDGLWRSADITLPAVTFERAGTGVMSRVIIIDKVDPVATDLLGSTSRVSLTGAQTIKELFDRIEDMTVPRRQETVRDAADEIMDETEAEAQAATAAVAPVVPGPALGTDMTWNTGETIHAKTGENLFVATASKRVDDDAYRAILAVAKRHGGWYSSFRGKGAIPGYQFKSEAQRAAFIEDMQKPTLGMQEPAYHGSPHEFDRFSLDHIGSGEGAQVYGWGLYFAGRREVAEYYKRTLARTDLTLNGAEIPQWLTRDLSADFHTQMTALLADEPAARPQEVSEDEWRKGKPLLPYAVKNTLTSLRDKVRYDGDDPVSRLGVYRSTALAQFKGSVERNENPYEYIAKLGAIDWLGQRVGRTRPARLYKVEVPEVSEMLDYDALLDDQPQAVRTVLRDLLPDMFGAKGESLWTEQPETAMTRRAWVDQFGWQIVEQDGGFFSVISPSSKAAGGRNIADKRKLSDAKKTAEAARKYYAADLTGRDAYNMLSVQRGGDRAASEALRAAGIPGHRYLDGSSRSAGEGSHNYVIYDDSRIEITGFEEPDSPAFQSPSQPETSELVRRAMPALRAELDRLDLKRVRLERAMGVDWQGAFEAGDDMRIIIGASLDPMATLQHEVIHALRAMDLFTVEEWRALTTKAQTDWLDRYDIGERYPQLDAAAQIEEAIAEAFSDAMATKTAPNGSLLVRSFNKIARVLRAFRNALRGAANPTAEDVFARAGDGTISARQYRQNGQGFGAPSQSYQAARLPSRQQRAHMATAMQGAAHIPDRRIWEELSRAGAPIWDRIRQGAGAAHDAVDRARIYIQDRFLPVLRAQEAVEALHGQPLGPSHNAYLTETTFSGKVGRHLFEIDHEYTKPIIDIIARTRGGLTAESVGTWLYARHAIERNAHIASINPAMPDGGSGMTNADAQMIMAQAAAGPHAAALHEIGVLIDALRERTITLRENAGLITHAEANLWRNQYRHYVPLKGFAETDHSEAMLDVTGTGRRFNTRGEETKRALGRRSEAFNPLQAAITQAQEVSVRAEKNRVGQAAYNLAKDFPSPALWSVKKIKMKRFYNRTTGLVESRPENPVTLFMDPNEMAVKVGGQEYRVIFHDLRLARALGSVGADRMNWFVQMLSAFGRFFSMTRTMLNPEFVLTNAFRDMTSAQVNIQSFGKGDKAALAKAMIRSWPKAFLGAWRGQSGVADSDWTRYYREFERAGAKVSFWTLEQPEAGARDLDRRIWLASGSRARRILKATVSPSALFSTRDNGVLHFIERTNMAVDNAIRLAAFVEARKRGWSEQEAAALSKNMTVNFNRRGEASATMNALYTFFNAAVQGSATTLKALATSRRVQMIAVGLVAAGFLNDRSNAYLSDEDDDEVLAYDKIPDWQSQRAVHFMLGRDSGAAASIPLPYGWNIFPYFGQQIGKVSRGVKTPEQALGDAAVAIMGAFSPVQGGDLYAILMPTSGDPLLEMARNLDWRGRPIKPDYSFDLKPESQKAFGGASEMAKWVAEAANSMTGGTSGMSGAIDISPEYIDHTMTFLTGSAGAFAGRTVDLLAKAATGNLDETTANDVPFLRTVVKDTYPGLDRDRYFLFRDRVEKATYAVKAAKENGETLPDEVRRWASLAGALKGAEKMRKEGREPYIAFNAKVTRLFGAIGE